LLLQHVCLQCQLLHDLRHLLRSQLLALRHLLLVLGKQGRLAVVRWCTGRGLR
jgi:hypothetical protein